MIMQKEKEGEKGEWSV